MARSGPTGEPGGGEIEATPEEVDRAGLARVATAEPGQDPMGIDQRPMKGARVRRVIARAVSDSNGIASSTSTGTGQIRTSIAAALRRSRTGP